MPTALQTLVAAGLFILAAASRDPAKELRDDARLQRKISLQVIDAPLAKVVPVMASQAKVPLTVVPSFGDLRLSLRVRSDQCVDVMKLMAAMLRMTWEPHGDGWELTQNSEQQQKAARFFQLYLEAQAGAERRQALARAKSQEIQLFAEGLLFSRAMTDAELLNHAKQSYPGAHELINKRPEALLLARVLTWLNDQQRSKLVDGIGLYVSAADVAKSGDNHGFSFSTVYLIMQEGVIQGQLQSPDPVNNVMSARVVVFQ